MRPRQRYSCLYSFPPDREVFCLPRHVNMTDQLWLHMVDVKHCSGQEMPQGREQSRKVQQIFKTFSPLFVRTDQEGEVCLLCISCPASVGVQQVPLSSVLAGGWLVPLLHHLWPRSENSQGEKFYQPDKVPTVSLSTRVADPGTGAASTLYRGQSATSTSAGLTPQPAGISLHSVLRR